MVDKIKKGQTKAVRKKIIQKKKNETPIKTKV